MNLRESQSITSRSITSPQAPTDDVVNLLATCSCLEVATGYNYQVPRKREEKPLG